MCAICIGMNEVLGDIYAITGDPKHLELAEKFCHRALLDPLSEGNDWFQRLYQGEAGLMKVILTP